MQTVPTHLDTTFAALADPTRRAILARLALGETTVMELAEPFAMSQPAVSKHLKVLERAGLVLRRVDAQRRPVRANVEALSEATEWIENFRRIWEENFRRLDALLEELQSAERKSGGAKPKPKK
jgi:DNA-binding transcriptional ArsR family regulator